MKGYVKYFSSKAMWFLITLVAAFVLNFILPWLMPGDPVAAIVARQAQGMSNTAGVQAIYDQYRIAAPICWSAKGESVTPGRCA